ncbi:MAG: glycosyltransferase family 2 protein [Ruminococcaceae bacterium]|nr:glycosyltransferase family 2 protein [Oscillospiraceae bacterium]
MVVTVAIPCYKSGKTIRNVVSRVREEIKKRNDVDYQFVLVNDGSEDGTFECIEQLCEEDKKITGIDLSKNFGQETATLAALHYVKGDVCVFMDDDGQHPAEEIYKLVDAVLEGNDIVYGKFKHKNHGIIKKLMSRLHGAISEFNGTKPKGISLSSYFALSRFSVDQLKKYKSPFVSRGGFLSEVTIKVVNVDISIHNERISGRSNYTIRKLFSMWMSSFTNFTIKPIRITASFGIIIALTGFIYGLILIVRKIVNPDVMLGFTSIMAVILFLGGMIMVMLGLLGEYIGRTYMTVSSLPQYVVRRQLNAEEN